MKKVSMHERYAQGEIPWDTGKFDQNLENILSRFQIKPCNTFELGCGTGTNAVWLAEQGFQVTAVDLVSQAIDMANKKNKDELCKFQQLDLIKDDIPIGPYSFVFDRGCLHSIERFHDKSKVIEKIYLNLEADGYYFSIIGSADCPHREEGPPIMTATEIITLTEPFFKIKLLEAGHFDSSNAPPAFLLLAQKRAR